MCLCCTRKKEKFKKNTYVCSFELIKYKKGKLYTCEIDDLCSTDEHRLRDTIILSDK